jgi:hypothetical protein
MKKKTVELPSGLSVTIKRIGPKGLQRVYGVMPNIDPAKGHLDEKVSPEEVLKKLSPEEIQANLNLSIQFCCACAVEPKIVDWEEGCPKCKGPLPEGSVAVDDMDMEDFNVLTMECIKLTNTKGALDDAAPFSETKEA